MRICTKCGTVFENYFEFDGMCCPIKNCYGEIIEVENDMYEIYKILIEKGYKIQDINTNQSFDKHIYDGILDYRQINTFVDFANDYNFKLLPEGYEKFGTRINKAYDCKLSGSELQKMIWKALYGLLEWAESLKEVEE